jgi:hypothetical protein
LCSHFFWEVTISLLVLLVSLEAARQAKKVQTLSMSEMISSSAGALGRGNDVANGGFIFVQMSPFCEEDKHVYYKTQPLLAHELSIAEGNVCLSKQV